MVCRQVMEMIDYEEMYYNMVRASEQAINILIQAQRECEELYLNAGGHAARKENRGR